MLAEYGRFADDAGRQGKLAGGAEVEAPSAARTVRVRDGKTDISNGPAVDGKTQLGGYFVLESPSLDEAVALAAKIPGARHGAVEVRPVVERT
jgi:hypothetical protein